MGIIYLKRIAFRIFVGFALIAACLSMLAPNTHAWSLFTGAAYGACLVALVMFTFAKAFAEWDQPNS